MEKPQKSQIAKISLIALLFLITPLLSTSMRPPYLYFLLNLLIIALGAEAGVLSFLTPSNDEKLRDTTLAPKPLVLIPSLPLSSSSSSGAAPVKEADHNNLDAVIVTKNVNIESSPKMGTEKKVIKVMEKSISEKIVSTVTTGVKAHNNVKKCPSMPSLFFIGGGEGDIAEEEDQWEEDQEEDMDGTLSAQELFTKAETFIGNFYKQLKIQREESWKTIHGFYKKAF